MVSTTLSERFWMKVRKTRGCWLWIGAKRNTGYGKIRAHYKDKSAHRVSYELEYGPIPKGQHVLHKCDTPLCVKPSHLFLGAQTDNHKDMCKKKRNRAPKGEDNGRVKLTKIKVNEIREQLLSNFPQWGLVTILGRYFNVTRQTIYDIQKEKTWR